MTFQANIPQAADLISVSQNDILQNFQAIGTSFDVNHIDFNAAGAGKHKFIELPNRNNMPAVAGQGGIFAFLEDLWVRKGAGTSYQLTAGAAGNVSSSATNGSSFVAGGMIVKWGTASIGAGSNSTTVTYTTAMPTATFVAFAIPNVNAAGAIFGVGTNTKNVNGFNINVNPNVPAGPGLTLFWFAIGN